MTCFSCGHVNPAESRFCGRCGAELGVRPPTQAEAAPQTPSPAPRPSPQGRPETDAGLWQRVLLGLAALVLVLGALSSTFGWGFGGLGILPLAVGVGLGIAAAQPPRSRIFRRLLVSFACLVLLLVAAGGGPNHLVNLPTGIVGLKDAD